MRRRARAWLGVVVGSVVLAACILNPQPEPPDRDYSPGTSSPPPDGAGAEGGSSSMTDAAADAATDADRDAMDGSDSADAAPDSDTDAAVDGEGGDAADGDTDGSTVPVRP